MFTSECDAFSRASNEGSIMSRQHGSETLNFQGFSGYYGSIPQGYGGFDWSEVSFLNDTYWENVKTNWCDTGYQNVVHGSGLAFTSAPSGEHTYGYFRAENLKQTFDLVSMVAGSAWENNQPFKFTSYVYRPGQGFVYKASATAFLDQTAHNIKFASLGGADDFKGITAVVINGGIGTYGNTCSYGTGYQTYGYELAFDTMKVRWHGKSHADAGMNAPAHPLFLHSPNHNTPDAHLVGALQPGHAHGDAPASAVHHAGSGYHAELLLPGSDSGLPAHLHIPGIEHFGT
jgi:hypothetical protein